MASFFSDTSRTREQTLEELENIIALAEIMCDALREELGETNH